MDRSEIETLEALVDMMRRKGVMAIEHNGTKVALGPEPRLASPPPRVSDTERPASPPVSQSTQDARDEQTAGRELTDDEVLFASSLGWPDERPVTQ
jgi:hypothetical protein